MKNKAKKEKTQTMKQYQSNRPKPFIPWDSAWWSYFGPFPVFLHFLRKLSSVLEKTGSLWNPSQTLPFHLCLGTTLARDWATLFLSLPVHIPEETFQASISAFGGFLACGRATSGYENGSSLLLFMKPVVSMDTMPWLDKSALFSENSCKINFSSPVLASFFSYHFRRAKQY